MLSSSLTKVVFSSILSDALREVNVKIKMSKGDLHKGTGGRKILEINLAIDQRDTVLVPPKCIFDYTLKG